MSAWTRVRGVFWGAAALLAAPASAQTVRICQVQGAGSTPAIQGRVTVTGVVIADFTATSVKGFFLQEPGCDSDAATSDGIFVSTSSRAGAVTVGNRVTASGQVSDTSGLTTITLESLSDSGPYAGSIQAVRLTPPTDPVAAAAYLEPFEGMLVGLPVSRVIAATNHYGDAFVMPESSGVTRLYRGEADGRKLAVTCPGCWLSVNQGDRLTDASGVLSYQYGDFAMLVKATKTPTVEAAALTPAIPQPTAGSFTVAAYNLENFFDAVDDPLTADDVPSSAQYAAGLAARAASIARYLGSPDVVGVEEAENLQVLQDLAAHPDLLPAAYRPVLIDGADSRGIDVGLLYRADRWWLRSSEARQGCTTIRASASDVPCPVSGGQGYALFARPPLVVKLESLASGERLTFIVNHFKAQEDGSLVDDQLRLASAAHVKALADELKTTEPEAAVLVLGDLNDFEDSATLAQLKAGGLVDLHGRSGERPYSYVYRGLAQVLDFALVDPALVPRVVDFRPVHINVDFGAPAPGSAGSGLHASDHDPVLLTLRQR
ncbi:MAG TPA: endonuclease/exonuclease/phosphatase family protein [Vicinamibacteria bacterium]|nr:endonuclease/exonuclease/phosphatase family protein [Vicinamibacteria bacterium]